MRYDYCCQKCKRIFEVSHGMREEPKVLCAECGGPCEKKISAGATGYVKGYGWFDKTGIRRSMNLHKLQNEDPYARYRTPGERSDLIERLKKGGKRNPRRQHLAAKKKTK